MGLNLAPRAKTTAYVVGDPICGVVSLIAAAIDALDVFAVFRTLQLRGLDVSAVIWILPAGDFVASPVL